MKIRSLIIPSLLAVGLSLGLSLPAQAGGSHYSVILHAGDHGHGHAKHHRDFRRHYKHDCRYHHDDYGHGRYKRHYGRFDHHHSDRYRGSRARHGSHGDKHDRGWSRG